MRGASTRTPRAVAIGDLNGADEALGEILGGLGLVDGRGRWRGGATHLVQVGDVFNRGPGARRALQQLRVLDRAARRAGGSVTVLLGNHEVMTALGNEAYCTLEEYLSFAPSGARAAWAGRYERKLRELFRDHAAGGPIPPVQPRLDAWAIERVPGRRALRQALGPRGAIGRTLRALPIAARAGRTVFLHSVPSLRWARLGVDGLNAAGRAAWATAPRFWRDLPRRHLFRAVDGPLWNRALVHDDSAAARREAERVAAALDADRLVVGHTQTDRVPGGEHGRIALLHDGLIACVDVSIAADPGAPRAALVIDGARGWERTPTTRRRLW